MADQRISDLPELTSVADNDQVIVNDTSDSNTTKRANASVVKGGSISGTNNDLIGTPSVSGTTLTLPRRSGTAYTVTIPSRTTTQVLEVSPEVTIWAANQTYNAGQYVTHQGRLYQARREIGPNIPAGRYLGSWTGAGLISGGSIFSCADLVPFGHYARYSRAPRCVRGGGAAGYWFSLFPGVPGNLEHIGSEGQISHSEIIPTGQEVTIIWTELNGTSHTYSGLSGGSNLDQLTAHAFYIGDFGNLPISAFFGTMQVWYEQAPVYAVNTTPPSIRSDSK